MTVNHSRWFVDPLTGVCTNHIENYWRNCKQKLKNMSGVANTTVESHLDEYLWRQRNGQNNGQIVFQNLVQQIAERFPVNF